MTMISVNEFKNGLTTEHNSDLWRIVEFQHVKLGKGSAFIRLKLKSLRTDAVQDYTFRSTEKVSTADIQTKPIQYLYNDGVGYVFMDMGTYEQLEIPNSEVERESEFLKENMKVDVTICENETLGIDLSNIADLEVAETEPGIREDTPSSGGRPVTTETSLIVNVPFFINVDDILAINASDGNCVSRTNKWY